MKILIPIKRVVDYNVRVRVKKDGSGVETANVKMSMNPFCEIAVEEAVRITEAGKADEIVVVTVGGRQCQDILRTALAMGADRAILIETDVAAQPLAIAKALKAIVEKEATGSRHHRETGHRRRQQPDGADALGPAGLAPGHVRIED